MKFACLLWIACTFITASSMAANYDAATFAKLPKYGDAELSLKGTYLAVQVPDTEFESEFLKNNLAIIRMKDRKPINVVRFAMGESVEDFFWDTDQRLIIRTAIQKGSKAPKEFQPNIYAINADGSKKQVIYGPSVLSSASRASKAKADNLPGFIIDRLRNDDDHILVAKIGESYSELVKVNTFDSTQRTVTKFPGVSYMDAVTTIDGQPVYFVGTDAERKTHVYKKNDGGGWSLLETYYPDQPSSLPITISEDGITYFRSNVGQEPYGIIARGMDDKNSRVVFRHPYVDTSPIFSKGRKLVAVFTEPGFPEYTVLEPTSTVGRILEMFTQTFPSHYVSVASITADDKHAIVRVASDVNWGELFLLDVESGKAEPLFNVAPWFDKNRLARKKPITIKARDGVELHGYLTLPKNTGQDKNLPMVVHPHGGPHGPRDHFAFDPEVAFLADNGYAVLQVNFRGSGGYGGKFERMGYRQWGLTMQDDLTDATKWAIEQGYADADRICISGASYGGYASLMGVVKEPDLYKCAVSYVGVSDLPLMFSKGDIQRRDAGVSYMKDAIGTDGEDLKARSPAYNADRIKANVLLVHGLEDERVPPAHYEVMQKALEKNGMKPELLVKSKEAHGFVAETNRKEYFEVLLRFLEKNIGDGR